MLIFEVTEDFERELKQSKEQFNANLLKEKEKQHEYKDDLQKLRAELQQVMAEQAASDAIIVGLEAEVHRFKRAENDQASIR